MSSSKPTQVDIDFAQGLMAIEPGTTIWSANIVTNLIWKGVSCTPLELEAALHGLITSAQLQKEAGHRQSATDFLKQVVLMLKAARTKTKLLLPESVQIRLNQAKLW